MPNHWPPVSQSPITTHPNNQWNHRQPIDRSPITDRLDDQIHRLLILLYLAETEVSFIKKDK
jgi:hypothetical protein